MAGCASCLHKNVHPNVCSDCLGGTHFKPKNKTKADLIRAMSDEELAEFFFCIRDDVASYYGGDGYEQKYPVASKGWLDWLRQEAEEDK